jgi:hypothetical protein
MEIISKGIWQLGLEAEMIVSKVATCDLLSHIVIESFACSSSRSPLACESEVDGTSTC